MEKEIQEKFDKVSKRFDQLEQTAKSILLSIETAMAKTIIALPGTILWENKVRV